VTAGEAHLDDPVPLLHPGSHGRPPCDTERRNRRQEGRRSSGRSQGLRSCRSQMVLAHSVPLVLPEWGHGDHQAHISHGTRLVAKPWVLHTQHPARVQLTARPAKPSAAHPARPQPFPSFSGRARGPQPVLPPPGSAPTHQESQPAPGSKGRSGAQEEQHCSASSPPACSLVGIHEKFTFPKAKTKRKMFPLGSAPSQGPETRQQAARVESTLGCLDSFGSNSLVIGKRSERGEGGLDSRLPCTQGPRTCPPSQPWGAGSERGAPHAAPAAGERPSGANPPSKLAAFSLSYILIFPGFQAGGAGEGEGGGNIRCKISSSLSI